MLSRILLDPEQSEGGAAAASVSAPAQEQPKPVVAKVDFDRPSEDRAKPEPPKLPVDPAHYLEMSTRLERAEKLLAEHEAKRAQELEAERKKAYEQIVAKEGAAKAVEEQFAQHKAETAKQKAEFESERTKIQAEFEKKLKAAEERAERLEQTYLQEKKESVINSALDGKQFASEYAEKQTRRLLNDRFDVVRDEKGQVVVRDKTNGQFASELIPTLLDSDEFAHFLLPKSSGGAGVSGAGAARDAVSPNSVVPAADDPISQIVAAYHANKQQKTGTLGLGFQRFTP